MGLEESFKDTLGTNCIPLDSIGIGVLIDRNVVESIISRRTVLALLSIDTPYIIIYSFSIINSDALGVFAPGYLHCSAKLNSAY
jgi:hypothetical protein